MIQLVINADDFGIHPQVDEAIIELAQKGIITSTSACMNMPHAVDKVKYLKDKVPELGIGVHLTLTAGYPARRTSKVQEALCPPNKKHFQQVSDFYFQRMLKRLPAVWEEMETQVLLLKEKAGVAPDHINCHHGILQLLPRLHSLYQQLADRHQLPMRHPVPAGLVRTQKKYFNPPGFQKQALNRGWLFIWDNEPWVKGNLIRTALRNKIFKNGGEFCERIAGYPQVPDYFVDNFYGNKQPMRFTDILLNLKKQHEEDGLNASFEMVTHVSNQPMAPPEASDIQGIQSPTSPWVGYHTEPNAALPKGINREYFPNRHREYLELKRFAANFDTPASLRQHLANHGIALAHFQDLRYEGRSQGCSLAPNGNTPTAKSNLNNYEDFPPITL